MAWWWWIVPTLAGVIGLVFLIKALGTLFRGRLISGGLGVIGGGGLLAAAVVATLAGLNLQTYGRLTHERPVATVSLRQLGPQRFEATVVQPARQESEQPTTGVYPLLGDEWRIEAQVLKWKPWATVLGLDTQYRLDRLSGRYRSIEQERTAERSVHSLAGGDQPDALPWRVEVWDLARRYRHKVNAVDTLYGGAAYMPMADGARYEVWITQSGLIARPTNDQARAASAGGWTLVS